MVRPLRKPPREDPDSANERVLRSRNYQKDLRRFFKKGAVLMASETQLRAENSKLRGHLENAIREVHFWRERAIFLEAERDYYQEKEGFY